MPTYSLPLREVEGNLKIPFMECLLPHSNDALQSTYYLKPTHLYTSTDY